LQQRYIELLEKRVAQLETAVKKAEVESAEKSSDSKVTRACSTKNPYLVPWLIYAYGRKGEANGTEGEGAGRYRNILRKWDKNSGSHKDEVVGANFFLKQQSKDIAYTFRRVYNPDTGEKGAYSSIDVEDPLLIALLKAEIGKYPGINFDSDIVSISQPFAPLVRLHCSFRIENVN
jgi:hypothetical protein